MEENDITEPSSPPAPMPPPSFEFLVVSIATQAQMQLGMFHFGEEKDNPEPDFAMARHSIDMLGMLQEKDQRQPEPRRRPASRGISLTELRFRYVQAQNK